VRIVHGLYLVAAVLAAVGLGLRVLPARAPSAPQASIVLPGARVAMPESAGDAASSGVALAVYDSIPAANIFSRTRKAPPRPGEVQHAAATPRVARSSGPSLTLLGTTIGPRGAVALIDANSGASSAEVHHMGDVVAGARLVAITDSTVTLDRPSGPLVLHLQSSQHKKL
jgi:hypothetical protein